MQDLFKYVNNSIPQIIKLPERNLHLFHLIREHGWILSWPPSESSHYKTFHPLEVTARFGWLTGIEMILDFDSTLIDLVLSENRTLLQVAIEYNQLEIVTFLLDRGASLAPAEPIRTDTSTSRYLLHSIAISGNVDLLKLLPSSQIRSLINSPDSNGFLPIHFAVKKGHLAMVEALAKIGAKIYPRTNAFRNCLYLACKSKKIGTFKMILKLMVRELEQFSSKWPQFATPISISQFLDRFISHDPPTRPMVLAILNQDYPMVIALFQLGSIAFAQDLESAIRLYQTTRRPIYAQIAQVFVAVEPEKYDSESQAPKSKIEQIRFQIYFEISLTSRLLDWI